MFGFDVLLLKLRIPEFWKVLWAHWIYSLPYVTWIIGLSYRRLDARYERIGLCLGASRWRTLFAVKLPIMFRSLVYAFAIAFAVSINEYLPTLIPGQRTCGDSDHGNGQFGCGRRPAYYRCDGSVSVCHTVCRFLYCVAVTEVCRQETGEVCAYEEKQKVVAGIARSAYPNSRSNFGGKFVVACPGRRNPDHNG